MFNTSNIVRFGTISCGLSYNSATVAVLFPTYSNTCSDRYVVRLLTVVFDSGVRATYSNVLHVMLNSEIANIAVKITGHFPDDHNRASVFEFLFTSIV